MANPYQSPKSQSDPPREKECVKPHLACPHCGGRAMSFWEKAAFGSPAFHPECRSCGEKIGIESSLLPALAVLFSVVLSLFYATSTNSVAFVWAAKTFHHNRLVGAVFFSLAISIPTAAVLALCRAKWGKLIKR